MWAKRLQPELKEKLMKNENRLISTVKEDLISAYYLVRC